MNELYMLPDGTWIDLLKVYMIGPRRGCAKLDIKDSVVVEHVCCTRVDCNSYDEAKDIAATIAAVVNQARRAVGSNVCLQKQE
jgi:hypothetical protein